MSRLPDLDDLMSPARQSAHDLSNATSANNGAPLASASSSSSMAFAYHDMLENPFADVASASSPKPGTPTQQQTSSPPPPQDTGFTLPEQSPPLPADTAVDARDALDATSDSDTPFPPRAVQATESPSAVPKAVAPAPKATEPAPRGSPVTSVKNVRNAKHHSPSMLRASFSAMALNDPLANPLAEPTTSVEKIQVTSPALATSAPPLPVAAAVTPSWTSTTDVPPEFAHNVAAVHSPLTMAATEETPLSSSTAQHTPAAAVDTPSVKVQVPKPFPDILPPFKIIVADPTRVGDTINPYILYKVHTQTTCPGFKSTSSVTRRYRDFLWLNNRLVSRYPGVIVPPIPEKQTMGRFQDDFVESRRLALERCLTRIAAHPALYNDDDFRVFLESEMLAAEMSDRKDGQKSGGVLSGVFGGGGSSAGSGATVRINGEVDEWFETQRVQLDQFEAQLRAAHKAVESIIKARKDLSTASYDMGAAIEAIGSTVIDDNAASTKITALALIHTKTKIMYDKLAGADLAWLDATIDEYIRTIGAIKVALAARARHYADWQGTEQLLHKKRTQLERNRTPTPALDAEVRELENKVAYTKKEFAAISKTVRDEVERYDKERVYSFQNALVQLMDSYVDVQRDIVRMWDTYFARK
ncbi:Vacuolar protein sorting-associated protein vps5 [Sorochytrium milnesiophthora]